MRTLAKEDAQRAVLGGGVLACGGGGWQHHGELMGSLATSIGYPVLASVDELPADSWVATVTAIGAPAAPTWEIQPIDYVNALRALIDAVDVPISAVMTAQNGYSTSLNGWIQSASLGIPVLDAAGDVRAHPTGKLGSMGLTSRPGYVSTQVVSGGNRGLFGEFLSINRGSVTTCDDVLRDISVRTGGFIAAARNPVELAWVKENAAVDAITIALELGRTMIEAAEAGEGRRGDAVIDAAVAFLGARIVARGPLGIPVPLVTRGGWDHGAFRVGEHTVPYLNEYMAVDSADGRVATYPDTIALLRAGDGSPLAVKDAHEGLEVVLIVVPAEELPLSSSAVDPVGLVECEQIMGIDILAHLTAQRSGARP